MCMYVLVCSDCCNKTPQTEWLINYTNVFLTVLEVGRLKTRGATWSSEDPFPGHRLLIVSSHGKGASKFSETSFLRTLIPFLKALLSQPNHIPKTPSPNTITLVIRISTWRLHSDINLQATAICKTHVRLWRIQRYLWHESCPPLLTFPAESISTLSIAHGSCGRKVILTLVRSRGKQQNIS